MSHLNNTKIKTNIKKGDEVVVLSGQDKGKRGSVKKVIFNRKFHCKAQRVYLLIEGVNMAIRHLKADPKKEQTGGRILRERPIAVSKVMLYNPQTQRGHRLGIRLSEDGKSKIRCFKHHGKLVGEEETAKNS